MKTECDFYVFDQGPQTTLRTQLNGEMSLRHVLQFSAQAVGLTGAGGTLPASFPESEAGHGHQKGCGEERVNH